MSSNPFSILEEVGELGEAPLKVKETKKPEKKKTEKKPEKKEQKKDKKPEKKEEKKQGKKQDNKQGGKQKNEKPAQKQQQQVQSAPTDDGFTQQTKKQKYNRRNSKFHTLLFELCEIFFVGQLPQNDFVYNIFTFVFVY